VLRIVQQSPLASQAVLGGCVFGGCLHVGGLTRRTRQTQTAVGFVIPGTNAGRLCSDFSLGKR
jgi:hypothetical protein